MFSALLAALAVTTATPKAPATAQPGLPGVNKDDHKLGCAILFVGFDELIRSNPGLLSAMGGGGGGEKALGPMLKMMGASSEVILNTAMADAAGQGQKPSDVYRRAISSVTAAVMSTPVEKGSDANEQRGMALFTSCMSAITD